MKLIDHKSKRRIMVYLTLFCFLLLFYHFGRSIWGPYYSKFRGRHTVEDVIGKYGDKAEARLKVSFDQAGIPYPPDSIKLLALKQEKILELWAGNGDKYHWVRNYVVHAASGDRGPKLKRGDRQVPEGFYRIIGLNPNSSYHLSLKLNYPNSFDLTQAEKESRTDPGDNIFIHGKDKSIGCLAMGDPAIEELFTLVYKVGKDNVGVVIAPSDPRRAELSADVDDPPWVADLYRRISQTFSQYPRPSL